MKKKLAAAAVMTALFSMTGCATTADGTTGTSGTASLIMIVGYMVIIIGVMYFVAIRPQKKEQKKQSQMLAALEVGDIVLTTSGFYGTVIDITDDTVIVEFGNNKNCRIPMQKSAIVESEKPDAE
jgi:preprotein translocase subunit YajC